MKEELKMFNDFFKWILSTVLGVCAFFIVQSYNRVNGNILQLQTEVLQMKMQLVEMNSKIVDEQKVQEIVRIELLKHGIKD